MKNIMNDKKNLFKIIMIVYLIISPIFDTIYLYNHITTLIRVIFIAGFLVVTLILYKDSRKSFKYLLAYYLALIGYLVISYIHSKGFIGLAPNLTYSIVSETTTIIKLAMPFTILFIMKFAEFSKKDLFKVINGWIVLIAGSVVLLNICGCSFGTYTDAFTKYSIFSWFKDLSVNEVATKGLFVFGNQVAVVLLMLLVMSAYETIFINKKHSILMIIIVLASLMLGTRISTIGSFLGLASFVIAYIVYSFITKKRVSKNVLLVCGSLLIFALLIPVSPHSKRMVEMRDASGIDPTPSVLETPSEPGVAQEKSEEPVLNSEISYIYENIDKKHVGERFYKEYYPCKYDLEFWNNIIEVQKTRQLDYRYLEISIVKRIKEIDNRSTNIWFGISNTRIQNAINIERDFILQYHAFGIIGIILTLMVYPYLLFKAIKNVFTKKEFINIALCVCLCLYLVAAYASGNSLNFLATIVPCSFVVSFSGKLKD